MSRNTPNSRFSTMDSAKNYKGSKYELIPLSSLPKKNNREITIKEDLRYCEPVPSTELKPINNHLADRLEDKIYRNHKNTIDLNHDHVPFGTDMPKLKRIGDFIPSQFPTNQRRERSSDLTFDSLNPEIRNRKNRQHEIYSAYKPVSSKKIPTYNHNKYATPYKSNNN